MNRAWTLRGHSVATSMDTLSPIPPMECPCPHLPSGRQRREAPPLAVPVAIRFRLQSFPL